MVDVPNQELCIGKFNKFHMEKKGHFGCFRVVNMNQVTIPANQEVIVSGQICVPKGECLYNCDGIIEPVERDRNDLPAIVGRTLVQSANIVPVRLLNPSDESCLVRKGMLLAQITPVEHVGIVHKSATQSSGLDDQLKSLLGRCSEDLSDQQKEASKRIQSFVRKGQL